MEITLRGPGGDLKAERLVADRWSVELRYAAAAAGAPSAPPPGAPKQFELYHILPPHIQRRGQASQGVKPKREPQPREDKVKREVVGGAARLPAAAAAAAAPAADRNSDLDATVSNSDETESVQRLPPTVIRQNRPDDYFLSFQSNERKELGALTRNGEGVKLSSTNGDFAEYHRRVEGEPEFEEGDVVGFQDTGDDELRISRVTEGAKAFGVISRQMVLEGKTPSPHEKHLFDAVAYTGQVPVKLRGHGNPIGAVVVPSGRHDGTAVVSDDSLTSQSLGLVTRIVKQTGASEGASEFRLVEIKVGESFQAARDAVAAKIDQVERNAARVGAKVTIVEQMSLEMAAKVSQVDERTRVPAWRRKAHVLGVAALVVVVASILYTNAETRQRISAVGCFAENVSVIELTRCGSCGSDAIVHFEHQHAGQTLEVTCPVGFDGALRRTCSGHNRSEFSGRCAREACPERRLKLPGGTALTVAPVAKGLTQVTNCPGPGFTGQLTQQCLENKTWGELVGHCTRHMCSSSTEYFSRHVDGFNSSAFSVYQTVTVVAPRADYGHTVQVAVCRQFTSTGSCKDNTAGDAGYARVSCDASSGKWNLDGDSSVFASGRSYDQLRMSKPLSLAQSMYHGFVSSVAGAVQPPTGSSWRLPAEGVLTSVMVGYEGERRDVFATADSPMERSDHPGSIDTNPSHNSQSMTERIHALAGGRAAASFARVACAELGFHEAPFVTSCQGLASLLDDLPDRSADATKMLAELCPEVQSVDGAGKKCPNWVEVRDPPLNDVANTQLDWLRASVLTPVDTDGLHAAPVFEATGTNGLLPDWRDLKSFATVGPVPESPSCDGTEDRVLRCFQRQMIIDIARRKLWKRNCLRRMIVGCSKPADPTPDDTIRPELGASILLADVKALPDYSGFAVSVAVRPADYAFGGQNITVEATLSGPFYLGTSRNATGGSDVTSVSCVHITRQVPVVPASLFPLTSPTSFELQLPPQCRHRWTPYRPQQYKIVLELQSFSNGGEQPALVDPRGSTLQKFAKLRSVTASDGTWVVGDSVRPYPDKSTPLTQPKIFVDTAGPFNCTTGELATKAEILASAGQLCWGKTIRDPVDEVGPVEV